MMQRDALYAFSPPSPRDSIATLGRIIFWQGMAGMAFALAALLIGGQAAGGSALLGAIVCLVPNVLFTLRVIPGMMLRHSPERAMSGFYTAEALKWISTAALFGVIFWLVNPLRPDMLFIGFLVTQFSIIFAALVAD